MSGLDKVTIRLGKLHYRTSLEKRRKRKREREKGRKKEQRGKRKIITR